MKKLITVLILSISSLSSIAQSLIFKQDAQATANELNIACQKLSIAGDACVIAHFKEGTDGDWILSINPADYYRVLNGKTNEGIYVATDYYNNGQQQTEPILTTNGSALLFATGSGDFVGNTRKWTRWSKNGKKIEETNIINGLPHGKYFSWSEDSDFRTEGQYVHGIPYGVWTSWDRDNKVSQQHYQSNNQLIETVWYENRRVKYKGKYLNDKPSGLWVLWYPNGKKAAQGNCFRGEPQENWKYWNLLGKQLARKEEWLKEIEINNNLAEGLFLYVCPKIS